MITTIDGWAGAGKTTLASHFAESFKDRGTTFIVHMDDLYNGWGDPFGTTTTEKLIAIAHAHISGESVDVAIFNWATNSFDSSLTIPPVDLLIIEGVGSGQRSIRDKVETKIWVEIEPIVGLRRVLERDREIAANLDEYEELMRSFMELSAKHFEEEGTVYASDFEVNGQATL